MPGERPKCCANLTPVCLFEADGAVKSVNWQFVGEGNGGYTKGAAYNYVGEGAGSYVQEEVEEFYGWRLRPCCFCVMASLGLSLFVGLLVVGHSVLVGPTVPTYGGRPDPLQILRAPSTPLPALASNALLQRPLTMRGRGNATGRPAAATAADAAAETASAEEEEERKNSTPVAALGPSAAKERGRTTRTRQQSAVAESAAAAAAAEAPREASVGSSEDEVVGRSAGSETLGAPPQKEQRPSVALRSRKKQRGTPQQAAVANATAAVAPATTDEAKAEVAAKETAAELQPVAAQAVFSQGRNVSVGGPAAGPGNMPSATAMPLTSAPPPPVAVVPLPPVMPPLLPTPPPAPQPPQLPMMVPLATSATLGPLPAASVTMAPQVHATPPTTIDCSKGFASWVTNWSRAQKDICCELEGKGCPAPIDGTFNCLENFRQWKSEWSAAKKAWCCGKTGKGCPIDE